MRLVRVVSRLVKLGKQNIGVVLLSRTLMKSLHALSYVAFFIFLFMVVYGSIGFFCEEGTFVVNADFPTGAYLRPQPPAGGDPQSTFTSIAASIYWAVTTR